MLGDDAWGDAEVPFGAEPNRHYVLVISANWGGGIRAGMVVLVAGVGSVTDHYASAETNAIAVGLSVGIAIGVIEWTARRFPRVDRSKAGSAPG